MNAWPELRYADWADTAATLHRWTQVVGKIRLVKAIPTNHWWHVPLYVFSRGMTTGPMPDGARAFEVQFDFIDHRLVVACSDGPAAEVPLRPVPVADFYTEVMQALARVGVQAKIWPVPSEIPGAARLDEDREHASYDPDYANRFWRVLLLSERVFTAFRSRFVGKVSPVHFFWGSFDLAVTRFSGRPAPPHPGVPIMPDFITREAYSHEVSSAGFWPGGPELDAVFYAYAYPTPERFDRAPVRPGIARFEPSMGEFVLPYAEMRASPDPDAALLEFLQSTYEAAADLAGWDREALER